MCIVYHRHNSLCVHQRSSAFCYGNTVPRTPAVHTRSLTFRGRCSSTDKSARNEHDLKLRLRFQTAAIFTTNCGTKIAERRVEKLTRLQGRHFAVLRNRAANKARAIKIQILLSASRCETVIWHVRISLDDVGGSEGRNRSIGLMDC